MTVSAQDTVAPPRNPCTAVGLGYAAGWKKTTMNLAVIHTPSSGANAAQWLSAGVVIVILFRYPFHFIVTAVARKRSWSFYQICRRQVIAEPKLDSHRHPEDPQLDTHRHHKHSNGVPQ